MKTNDKVLILKDTKCLPGNVYIMEEDGNLKLVERYSGIELYDTVSKNFHIFPYDTDIRSSLSTLYKEKRSFIRKLFENYFKDGKRDGVAFRVVERGTSKPEPISSDDPSDAIKENELILVWGFGSGGGRGELYGLYKYLSFYYKDAWYRIKFNRLYIEETSEGQKIVSCIMNCLQYDKDTSDNGYGLNKDSDGITVSMCYPLSSKGDVIQTNSTGNKIYNPDDASFYGGEEIVKSFLKFVVRQA